MLCINSIPNNEILNWSNLKEFADDKLLKIIFLVFDRVENTVGKGENAGYQHFLLFLSVFKGLFTQGPKKSGLCGKELNQ